MSLVDADPKGPNVLTQDEAIERSKRVSEVQYGLHLVLAPGSPTYRATVEVSFKLSDTATELFLDFIGKEILSLRLNDKEAVPLGASFRGNRIFLPASGLLPSNRLVVEYVNDYSHTGEGFHQYIDPQDKKEYVYSNFCPFEAHRMFPSFDQPDLKARYTVTVEAPSDWIVLSNYPSNSSSSSSSSSTTKFDTTAPLSTYLFNVTAGPLHCFEDLYEHGSVRIQMRIFCRSSMAKFVDAAEIFSLTKAGITFFADFFDFPFPFPKYDQVFAPEFNWGGMENPGVVLYSESHLFREPPTILQKARRADTVLHELSHMWFGDLVTPVWWDNIWLNESFATYMASLAIEMCTPYDKLGAIQFNTRIKTWAYREDQLRTTHPIKGIVRNTDESMLNFDGITYGKGASVLKQLVSFLGLDAFRKGMALFFKRHAWGNATLEQFLSALESAAGTSLTAWAASWLQTTGVNSLAATYTLTHENKIDSFTVTQTAIPEHPTLRPHHIEILVLSRNDQGEIVENGPFSVHVEAAAETKVDPRLFSTVHGRPVAIFSNYNDHAYCKVILDTASLAFFTDNLSTLRSALLRQLLWQTLHGMVRDARMRAQDFVTMVIQNIPRETDFGLRQFALNSANSTISSYVPRDLHHSVADSFFQFALAQLKAAEGDENRLLWARTVLSAASGEAKAKILVDMLGDSGIPGFAFDQSLRWSIVQSAVSHDLPSCPDLLAAEIARDASDRGRNAATLARAAVPTPENKAAVWERLLDPQSKDSFEVKSYEMSGFRSGHKNQVLKPYKDLYFQRVRDAYRLLERKVATAWCSRMFPFDAEDDSVFQETEKLLASCTAEEANMKRTLQESYDDLVRCRNARRFSAL